MKIALLMSDAAGYPVRADILARTMAAAGVHFRRISPRDKLQPGAWPVDLPDEWLPADDRPRAEKEWGRNHLHYLAAIRTYGIKADYYWCVEGDVAASPLTWLRMLETTADMTEDGLWTRLYTSALYPSHPAFVVNPKWVSATCLGAICRVSAAGMAVWEETAVETREMFTEHAAPSVLVRAGLKIGKINRPGHPSLYHCGTMKFNPQHATVTPPIFHPRMFRHPVKVDDSPA